MPTLVPMSHEVVIDSPCFWWRARPSVIRRWVPSSPEGRVDRPRHPDRDDQDWSRIATAVAAVGDALATGSWRRLEDQADLAVVSAHSYPKRLSPSENEIVASWFAPGEAVLVDPWFTPITNGRHRLWSTLPHFAGAPVPVSGDVLGYANAETIPLLGANWARSFARHLEALNSLAWFDVGDPVNVRFKRSLQTAALGGFPPRT